MVRQAASFAPDDARRAGRREPLVLDALGRAGQPAIQVGRLGAVEVHPGDAWVVGKNTAKSLTTTLFGSIAESAMPARWRWCSTSQSATP